MVSPQLGVGADLAAGVADCLLAALRQAAVPHLQILKLIMSGIVIEKRRKKEGIFFAAFVVVKRK